MTSSRGATHWSGDIMTHDDASVETGVGGQAKYDMMMVFCGNALQKHHKTLKSSTRRYPDCHILHILHRYNKYDKYYCIPFSFFEQGKQ